MRTSARIRDIWLGRRLLGQTVDRATAALPQTNVQGIFTVSSGRIQLMSLLGEVTTVVGGVANVTRFTFIPVGPLAEQNLCAPITDINALAVASLMGMTGVPTDAMLTGLGTIPGMTMPTLVWPGTINIRCAGSDGGGGRVKYTLKYIPYDYQASVAAV